MKMLDSEIVKMQDDFHAANRIRRRWIIVEMEDGSCTVHEHSIDGVAPAFSYPTRRLAAARVLQLLRVGPVAPQNYPEEVCVGSVSMQETDPKQ